MEHSGLNNVSIIWNDINRVSYRNATILYSVITIGFEGIKKIQREAKTGALVVLYGLPPFPVRSRRLFAEFYAMRTPFERVADEDEFARIHLGRKKATIKGLLS